MTFRASTVSSLGFGDDDDYQDDDFWGYSTCRKSLDDYAIPSTTSTRTRKDEENDNDDDDDGIDEFRLLLPQYSLPDLSLLPSPILPLKSRNVLLKKRDKEEEEQDKDVVNDDDGDGDDDEEDDDDDEEEDDYFSVEGNDKAKEEEEEEEKDVARPLLLKANPSLSSSRRLFAPPTTTRQVSFRRSNKTLVSSSSRRHLMSKQASRREHLQEFSRPSPSSLGGHNPTASLKESLRQSHAAMALTSRELSSSSPADCQDLFQQVFHIASSEGGASKESTRALQNLLSQKSMRLGFLAAMEGNEDEDDDDEDEEDWYLDEMSSHEATTSKFSIYKHAPRKGIRGVRILQTRNLFARHASQLQRLVPSVAMETAQIQTVVHQAAQQAELSRAIYYHDEKERTQATMALGHVIQHLGCHGNLAWMVTESTQPWNNFFAHPTEQQRTQPPSSSSSSTVSVLTLTVRGFDAQDPAVDSEQLAFDTAHAQPIRWTAGADNAKALPGIWVHSGLWRVAQQVYREVLPLLENKRPEQRIVLNGHSLGGTTSVLILLLLTLDKGADYVRRHVLRVYTFGSPSVVMCHDPCAPEEEEEKKKNHATTTLTTNRKAEEEQQQRKDNPKTKMKTDKDFVCPVLQTIGLPSSMVYGYIQPWDFIPRLFTSINPAYYCFHDSQGYDLLKSCRKPRFLRPLVNRGLRQWPRWMEFRALFLQQANQRYQPVGIQHLLVPPRRRYVSDRFTRTTAASFPPLRSMQRLSPTLLWTVLEEVYPLDAFRLSKMLVLLRSLLHHLNPAYSERLTEFALRMEKKAGGGKKRGGKRGGGGGGGEEGQTPCRSPTTTITSADQPNNNDDNEKKAPPPPTKSSPVRWSGGSTGSNNDNGPKRKRFGFL